MRHHNNHFTALYGLAAASDVEGERKREGGSCGWTVTNPRLALSVCHRVRTHSVAAHTSMHSISLYLGLTLVKSHFCDYLSVVTAHSLKILRSSGSQFDSESRRNVRKKYKVLTLETKIAFGRYGYQRGGVEAHAAGRWPIPCSTTQHIGGSPTTPPRFALSVRYRLRAQCQIYRKARSIQIKSNANGKARSIQIDRKAWSLYRSTTKLSL